MNNVLRGMAVTVAAVVLSSCANSPTGPSGVTAPALGPSVQFSHDDGGGSGNSGGGVAASDMSFVVYAANFHRGLAALGHLANSRGDRPEIKLFGGQLLQAHTMGLQDLSEISGGGIGQGFRLTNEFQAQHDTLQRQSGSEFDRLFMAMVVQHLEAAITRFAAGRASGHVGLREHAIDAIGTMTTRLNTARELARRAI